MSEYTRRPFLAGNTEDPTIGQATMYGAIAKDSSEEWPGMASGGSPAELRIETDLGTASAQFTASTMAHVLTQINAVGVGGTVGVTASDVEGVLCLTRDTSGDGTYVRIVSGILGLVDAGEYLGLRTYPHPNGTVEAGDLASTPPRPLYQRNATGTAMLAQGEERLALQINRVFHYLAKNTDYAGLALTRPIAVPVVEEITSWADARLRTNVDGHVDQVNLSANGRLFVGGGLSNASSLDEMAQYWSVVDRNGKEIQVWDGTSNIYRTVRVAAVTRGNGPVLPSNQYSDEFDITPATPVADTSATAPDGGNALGVDRTVSTSVAITTIKDNTTIKCSGATFSTDGVVAGHVATISGAAVDNPFNHNGTYIVETVVNEEELVLKPSDHTSSVQMLNDTTGVYGNVVITTGGSFESDIYVGLWPPLPRMPEDGAFRIMFGAEGRLTDLSDSALLEIAMRSSDEVDDFTQQKIYKQLSFSGIYDAGEALGAGYHGEIDNRPVMFFSNRTGVPDAGTLDRTGTGDTEAGNILKVAAADSLTTADLGRIVKITKAGSFLDEGPHVIVELLTDERARIMPAMEGMTDDIPVAANVTYDIYDDAFTDFPAMVMAGAQDEDGSSNRMATPGFSYMREQTDSVGVTDTESGLQGITHIERLRLRRGPTNALSFVVTPGAGTNTVGMPFDPEDTYNIYAEDTTETKHSSSPYWAGSLLRILNGNNAGWYRVTDSHSVTVTANGLDLAHLDGSAVAFAVDTSTIYAAIYNVAFATKQPLSGTVGGISAVAGAWFHHDAHEEGDTWGAAVGANFRGTGAAFYAQLNDPNFVAYDNADGSTGEAAYYVVYPPAEGVKVKAVGASTGAGDARRGTFAYRAALTTYSADLNINAAYTGWDGAGIWIAQGGKDPAVIFSRHNAVAMTPAYPDMQDFTIPAAMVLATSGDIVGKAGAGAIAGSLYAHREITGGVVDWDNGAFYAEETMAARFVQPMVSGNATSEPFYGNGSYDNFDMPTKLGMPTQVYPRMYSTAAPAGGALTAPDYSTFNFPHTGTLTPDAASLDDFPRSVLVGMRIAVDTGTYAGAEYTIVGVDPNKKLALQGIVVLGADSPITWRLLGNRFYESHIDMADWTQIGTEFSRGNPHLIPVLTINSEYLYDSVDRITPPASGAASSTAAVPPDSEGLLSTVQLSGDGYGPGTPYSSIAALAASDWDAITEQPRAPFPNIYSQYKGTLSGTTILGDLGVDNIAFSYATATTFDAAIGYEGPDTSADLSGKIKITGTSDVAGSTIRVWSRGIRDLPVGDTASAGEGGIYAIRGTAVLQDDGVNTATLTLALRASDGTAIATNAVGSTAGAGGIEEFQYSFTASDIFDWAYNSIDTNVLRDEGLHLTLDIAWSAASAYAYLHAFWWESVTRPMKVEGSLEVTSGVRSSGFRYVTPVVGYDTIGPARASVLFDTEYAKLYGNEDTAGARDHGIQEGHDTGYIHSTGAGWYKPDILSHTFFKKGHHAAAITFDHPYFDPLFYVLATGGTYDSDKVVLPGYTGFIFPLNPPHGSRITTLQYSLSLRPCYFYDSSSGSNPVAAFQVWKNYPASLLVGGSPNAGIDDGGTATTWINTANWDAEEGFVIRVWRSNILDFDKNMDKGTYAAIVSTPPYGYAEEIWSAGVDLSGVTEPGFSTGSTALEASEYTVEAGARFASDSTSASNRAKFIVDRRHYDYFCTIEFMGGCRNKNTATTYAYNNTTKQWITGSQSLNSTLDADARRVLHVGDPTATTYGETPGASGVPNELYWPPVVKFRGARLGWVTDRAGVAG